MEVNRTQPEEMVTAVSIVTTSLIKRKCGSTDHYLKGREKK